MQTKQLAATRTLLATLVQSTLREGLLQIAIEALMELIRVKYGAIAMLGENGHVAQFVHAGMNADVAAQIGTLPVGGAGDSVLSSAAI